MSTSTVTPPITLPIDHVGEMVWDPAACIKLGEDSSFVMIGTRADFDRLARVIPRYVFDHNGFTHRLFLTFCEEASSPSRYELLDRDLRRARYEGVVMFAVVAPNLPDDMRHWLKNP